MDNEQQIPDEMMAEIIKSLIYMIGAIDMDTLESFADRTSRENVSYDALVPMVDPTFYRNHGRPVWFDKQLEIVKSLLKIRRAVKAIRESGVTPDEMAEQVSHIANLRWE